MVEMISGYACYILWLSTYIQLVRLHKYVHKYLQKPPNINAERCIFFKPIKNVKIVYKLDCFGYTSSFYQI